MKERHTENLIGKKFGRLTIINRAKDAVYPNKNYKDGFAVYPRWECLCDCGNFTVVRADSLKNGCTKSCGCLQKEKAIVVGQNKKKYNNYDLSGEYGIGYTTKNEPFYFDLEDYELIKNYCWYYNNKHYVVSRCNHKQIAMHILLTNHKYKRVDHQNRIAWDNRKENLRDATVSQNAYNTNLSTKNTSGIKGVYWRKRDKVWQAAIGVDGKQIWLGQFKNKEEAIIARLKAELKYCGEFAPQKDLFKQYGIGEE